jgi:hypothetical protein
MIRLPALTAEEHAFFARAKNEPSVLNMLAERVRCRLAARLGVSVQCVDAWEIKPAGERASGTPVTLPGEEMKSTWLAARFGGVSKTSCEHVSTGLTGSLDQTLTLALAEAAINLGDGIEWPEAVGMALAIQNARCEVVFYIDPGCLMNWARSEMEKPR